MRVRQSITEIFESNHRCYGYRRLQASLAREQGPISEKVIQRLMKQESLVVAKPKRRRYASYLGEISPAPENIINRDFQAAAPNKKWLTDITEFQIPAGKVYLSPIIDCFDGMVVSWTIARVGMQSWSTPCWMQPSRPSQRQAIDQWSTQTAEVTAAGLAGYPE